MTQAISEVPDSAYDEWPFLVALLPVSKMFVDDSYQRPPHRKFISDMVDAFDETLVGTIDVSERASGYAVLDGQQRFMAMQQVGKTACFASVYTGMTVPDEAAFFYKKNRDRMSMGAYYGFRARVVAGDLQANQIQETVHAVGFTLGDSTNSKDVIGAVSAVETVWGYDSAHRDECLTRTLETIHRAVWGRKDSLHSHTLQGLGRFWQTYADEEVDRPVLHAVMQEIGGPTAILGMAKDKRVVSSAISKGSSIPWLVARVLSEQVNRSLRGNRRGRNFAGRLPIERLGV